MLDAETDKEFHKAHSELANTIGGLNTALRTTSQATGGVAATKGLPELNVDAMILDVYLNGGEYSFKMEDGVVVDIHGTEDKSTVNVVCSPPEPKRKGQEE